MVNSQMAGLPTWLHRRARPAAVFTILATTVVLTVILWSASTARQAVTAVSTEMAALRAAYAGPPALWPKPETVDGIPPRAMAPLPPPPFSTDDAVRRDARIALGERLFNEPLLSRSGQIACADCHFQELGFTDRLRTSFGHDRARGGRNAVSLLFAGYYDAHFWDGRAANLEDQALAALSNPVEMAATPKQADDWIATTPDYRPAFAKAFGDNSASLDNALTALADFVRDQRPMRRFDAFLDDRRDLFSDSQLRGLHLFRTKGRCMTCHDGPLLSDGDFHNLGIHRHGYSNEDLGRYAITGADDDRGRFRTPTLRGVAATGPWMHTGRFQSLPVVVAFYNAGGIQPKPGPQATAPAPTTSPLLKPLSLTRQEIADIVAFLETL